MRSIGIDLEPWMEKGLLKVHASRPTLYGLEMHLVMMYKLINEFGANIAVIDPVTNLISWVMRMKSNQCCHALSIS